MQWRPQAVDLERTQAGTAAFMARPRRRIVRMLATGVLLCAVFWIFLGLLLRPSNTRDWNTDQVRLATAERIGDRVGIDNVRNASYRSTTDFDVRWETRRYDLAGLESVWFVVEPFADWRGPAHTFLSFGFDDGEFVAISVEIRKERGESFSPLLGLMRQYEIAYVIGDERDLIGLRAWHRRDQVYLYPIRTTRDKARALFVSMLERANRLALAPEFYNTLTNTCTSNIVDHIESIAPGRVPWSVKTLLPAHADDLAYDLGLIDTSLARTTYRAAHRIDLIAAQVDRDRFSSEIRRHLKIQTATSLRTPN
jgi:hypothetical protein